MPLCTLRGCGYPEAQPRGPQYLTYCAINLVSDWSRAKPPGGGAVPIKESVATENASQPTQKTRGEILLDFLPSSGYTSRACCWKYTRSLLETSAPPKTAGFIPSPSHFNLCVSPAHFFLQRHQCLPLFFWASLRPFWPFWLSSTTPFFFGLESDMRLCILLLLTNQMN